MRHFSLISIGIATVSSLVFATICCGGPKVTVGANVTASRRIPVDRIDHSTWDALLKKHVDANGYVDYTRWKASAADQKSLDEYLGRLSAASFGRDASREGQLAYWINAYNALTIKGILREYPTTSIRNHTARIYGYNIWKDLQLMVADRSYSLEGIEHEVLRKMGEPRIHFAIVCASIGCPRLRSEAYVAQRIDGQLTANAQSFFADSTKFRADGRTATIQLSPVLKWFAEDFGVDTAAQLRTIATYLPANTQPLVRSGKVRVSYLDYDWGLNDQAKLRTAGRR